MSEGRGREGGGEGEGGEGKRETGGREREGGCVCVWGGGGGGGGNTLLCIIVENELSFQILFFLASVNWRPLQATGRLRLV